MQQKKIELTFSKRDYCLRDLQEFAEESFIETFFYQFFPEDNGSKLFHNNAYYKKQVAEERELFDKDITCFEDEIKGIVQETKNQIN